MDKRVLGVVGLALLLMIPAVPASAGDGKMLYFNIEPVAGLGLTTSKTYKESGNAEFHLGAGATLFSLDKKGHIGLLGIGTAVDFYDFSMHPSELRDLSEADGGDWGLAGYANVVGTIIPIRIGPLAYQFSWNGHVKALGVDRGRLHLFTLDVLGLVRLLNDKEL